MTFIIPTAARLAHTEEYYFSRKLQEIAQMRTQGADVINLGIGSPDLAPAPEVLRAAIAAIENPKNHGYAAYRSSPELRQAQSEWYARVYKVALNPDFEVLPLLGSKEGILYLSMAYLNPGDEVLIPNPGYPAYAATAELIGAKPLYYDLNDANGWLPDLARLAKLDLSRVKLMWVNYPHMPSGTVAPEGFFDELVTFAQKHHILICNDNPYGLILNDGPPRSLLSSDPNRNSVVELNSLSKSFNMAGWRVGIFAGAREAVDAVIKVKSNVDSGMFTPIQAGAIAALGLPDRWHTERNRIYRGRRDEAQKIFAALGFQAAAGQVGLFVWARAPQSVVNVEKFVDAFLHEAHVFMTPGTIFGSNGERYARISLCAPAERLALAAVRAAQFATAEERNLS